MHDENHTLQTAVDLSAAIYHIVGINGVGQVNISSLSTHSSMIGILKNAPVGTASKPAAATVGLFGTSRVVAGAAIGSTGVWFTCNGSGRAIAAASGDMVAGRVLETATANGDTIRCLEFIPFRLSGAI